MTKHELQNEILDFTHTIHREMQHIIKRIVADTPLSAMQLGILHQIIEEKGMRISQISRILEVSDSNVSAICQRMEKEGLVTRKRDEQDQRVVIVTATPKGEKLMVDLQEEILRINRNYIDALSHEQLSNIHSALKIIAAMF